jgi:hypothetical protein
VLEVHQFGEELSRYLPLDYVLLHAVCFLAHQWLVVLDVLWQICGMTLFLSAAGVLKYTSAWNSLVQKSLPVFLNCWSGIATAASIYKMDICIFCISERCFHTVTCTRPLALQNFMERTNKSHAAQTLLTELQASYLPYRFVPSVIS